MKSEPFGALRASFEMRPLQPSRSGAHCADLESGQ
nr:MAG TPA: hypothetical protein [Caudoviricetes sp.]